MTTARAMPIAIGGYRVQGAAGRVAETDAAADGSARAFGCCFTSLPEMDASDAEVEVAPLPLLLRQPSNTQGEARCGWSMVCGACGAG